MISSCSFVWAPLRWLVRNPLLGHAPMHPQRTPDHGLTLQCFDCRQVWTLDVNFRPSPVFQHRRFVAAVKGVGNVITFQKRKDAA